MAYIKTRMRQKTASGYDVVHLESRSDLIIRYTDTAVENGTVESAIRSIESSLTSINSTLTTKAAKVSSATTGNFAGLSASGDLTDSGVSSSTFAAASHTHTLANITGATASRALVTNASGTAVVSAVTATELGYLDGVTSAIQTQLNNKAASSHNHDTVYVAQSTLGVTVPTMSGGKIETSYLPSYVDDVLDGTYVSTTTFNDTSGTAYTAEAGKIYVDTTTNKVYRWSGTQYVEISGSLALGTTSSTAYRGDRGLIAYNHSQTDHARADATLTAASTTNGNLAINGAEVTVYTHPTYAGTRNTASSTVTTSFTALSAVTLVNGHVSNYTATTFTLPTVTNIQTGSTQPTDQSTNDIWFETIS